MKQYLLLAVLALALGGCHKVESRVMHPTPSSSEGAKP